MIVNRTLQQLKESVEKLIEQQDASAPCAAYIFTKEDVYAAFIFTKEDDNDDYFSEEITNKILKDLDETDSILEKAFECLEEYIKENKK